MSSFTVKVGESVVEINPDDLKFTDATINVFFEKISGKIDYIGRCLANAQRICSLIEQKTDLSFINEFKKGKEEGKSDKSAELYAKGSDEVQKYKKALNIKSQESSGKRRDDYNFIRDNFEKGLDVWENESVELSIRNYYKKIYDMFLEDLKK